MSLVDEALKKAHADLSQRQSEMIPAPVPQQMSESKPSNMPVVVLMIGAGVFAAVICGVGFYFLQAQAPADQPTIEVATAARPADPPQQLPPAAEPVAQASVAEPADPAPIVEPPALAAVEPPPTPAEAPDAVTADADSPADTAPEPSVAALTVPETDPLAVDDPVAEPIKADELPPLVQAPLAVTASAGQAIAAGLDIITGLDIVAGLDIVTAVSLAPDASPATADTTSPTEPATAMADEADVVETTLPIAATTDAPSRPVPSHRRRFEMPDGTALELNAIAWSETRPVALINGSVLMVGESTDAGAVVASIERKRVKLRTPDNQQFYLRLK